MQHHDPREHRAAPVTAEPAPARAADAPLLDLQRAVGNQALSRMLGGGQAVLARNDGAGGASGGAGPATTGSHGTSGTDPSAPAERDPASIAFVKQFFSHYLPHKFLTHYGRGSGEKVTLTEQEMIDCNATVDVRSSPEFKRNLDELVWASGGTRELSFKQSSNAHTNGTLGRFTIFHTGRLTVEPSAELDARSTGPAWRWEGTMSFYDEWDFDPNSLSQAGTQGGRSTWGEIKVRFVDMIGLAGKPFKIDSVPVPVTQTNADPRGVWAGGTPKAVGDDTSG